MVNSSTYSFTNITGGYNSTNYSTGTSYLNNIKSNNLQVNSNIILSNNISSWIFPSMLGSQTNINLATHVTIANGVWYNILSYTIPQIGVYNIQSQFLGIFGSNDGVSYFACSISTTSGTADNYHLTTVLIPAMSAYNHFTPLNRVLQVTNTTTTIYMVAMANYCTTAAYLNNNQTYMKITRIA
jgi:hypothetical protein